MKYVAVVMALVLAGCGSTPPPVKEASKVEREALLAFKADHDAIVDALFSDLHLALETQIRLIENYEIKAKGPNVPAADLAKLLEQARQKREETAAKLKALRAKVKTADRNFEIALQIHDSIDSFLRRAAFDGASAEDLIRQVGGLKDSLGELRFP